MFHTLSDGKRVQGEPGTGAAAEDAATVAVASWIRNARAASDAADFLLMVMAIGTRRGYG
jgi:hypothetical protein